MFPRFFALLERKRKEEGREGSEGQDEYSPEQVLKGRDGGRFAAVVLVAVDVEHSFAADREHPREDAFLETGAEHDCVVFFIHVRAGRSKPKVSARSGGFSGGLNAVNADVVLLSQTHLLVTLSLASRCHAIGNTLRDCYVTRHSAENGRKTNSFSRYFDDDGDGDSDGGGDGGGDDDDDGR